MRYFYVISPVSADPDFKEKKHILEEEGQAHHCEPYFPLERRQVFSVAEARSDMASAAFVLADLSFERPSCYFELGLAQALGVPIAIIATQDTVVHQIADSRDILWYFDLSAYRALVAKVIDERSC